MYYVFIKEMSISINTFEVTYKDKLMYTVDSQDIAEEWVMYYQSQGIGSWYREVRKN